jgi:acetamidase/formamidase
MARRGLSGVAEGETHYLGEDAQGAFHYTIGPYSTPVLTVAPGDRVVVETRDAFDGAIRTERDLPTERVNLPFTNPQNGPILVDGAQSGDALAVAIESIVPRGAQPRGTVCLIPHFGALTGTALTATLNDPLPELVRKVVVDHDWVHWSPQLRLPYNPHIGTLSCSPQLDSINTLTPDSHGGNMDLPAMGPGTVTYLPVRVPGARLFIGDAHACQGDGEVCGTALEIATTTAIRVDVVSGWGIDWPRLETVDRLFAIGSGRPLEDATRIAFRELIQWMETDYGFDRWDAYMLLSLCGEFRLGNVVDPKYTVAAGLRKAVITAAPGDAS